MSPSKPEFKLFPCIFCTLGFNSYIAVRKLSGAAARLVKGKEITEIPRNEAEISHSVPDQSPQ